MLWKSNLGKCFTKCQNSSMCWTLFEDKLNELTVREYAVSGDVRREAQLDTANPKSVMSLEEQA